ncbi:MAG: hypothetical protein ABIK52_09035, partial [Bacteroidota bacterium]
MQPVYIVSDNIITSLGATTTQNMEALKAGHIGISMQSDPLLFPSPVPLSLVNTGMLEEEFQAILEHYKKKIDPMDFTRLEKLFIMSI